MVPIVELPVIEEPVVEVPSLNLLAFLFVDKFDSYDRDDQALSPEVSGGLFGGLGNLFEELFAYENGEEVPSVEGDEILDQPDGFFEQYAPGRSEEEEDEEERKRLRHQNLSRAVYGQFWSFNVNTNRYSSYAVFGVPAAEIGQ